MKILIIKLGAIGDVLRTTSALIGLKEKYPYSEIYWVTEKESADLLKNNQHINKIFIFNHNTKNELKNIFFEKIICLDDEYKAAELASSLKQKEITGAYLDKDKKITYTLSSAEWFDMGLVSRFGKEKADELKKLNKKTYQEIIYKILGLNYKEQEPILILSKKRLDYSEKFANKNSIKKEDLVIGVNTGAGGRWEDKKLSIEKTAELIDKLSTEIKNSKIILFGGNEEKERNKKIKEMVGTKVIDAGCENTLMEFASLINLCNVLVTSDSLALHIGTALKKRIVVFFYPTASQEIELYGRGIKIIWEGKSNCSYQPKCDYPPKVNIEKIIDSVKKLLR